MLMINIDCSLFVFQKNKLRTSAVLDFSRGFRNLLSPDQGALLFFLSLWFPSDLKKSYMYVPTCSISLVWKVVMLIHRTSHNMTLMNHYKVVFLLGEDRYPFFPLIIYTPYCTCSHTLPPFFYSWEITYCICLGYIQCCMFF